MHPVRRCFFTLLLYIGWASAAPLPDPNFGLSLFIPTNNATNNSFAPNIPLPLLTETILYAIPYSTFTLALNPQPHNAIAPSDLSTCLYATSTRVLSDIRRHGDGLLARYDDPFVSDPFPDANCRFGIRSWKRTTRRGMETWLTYGDVHVVLRGLLEWMLWPDPHYHAVSFTVRDSERGIVGAGSVGKARW